MSRNSGPRPHQLSIEFLKHRIAEAGFDDPAFEFAATAGDLRSLLAEAVRGMEVAELTSVLSGVVRFVGPPGVGKSTALIRVLGHYLQNNDPTRVLVVGADADRLGGGEQIALAAELLGVPYEEASGNQLAAAVGRHGDAELILVDDTSVWSGVAPANVARGSGAVLVVSAAWQSEAINEYRLLLGTQPLRGVILTHTDLAPCLLPVLGVLKSWRLPLLGIGVSASLTDGLRPAEHSELLALGCRSIDRWEKRTIFSRENTTFAQSSLQSAGNEWNPA